MYIYYTEAMKKVIVGIFAHPDDEAFGVSPTLIKEIREDNAEVHLVTLTIGQNGENPDHHGDLGDVRAAEWRKGGQLMGVTSMIDYGYTDGMLCNNDIEPIAKRLTEQVVGIIQQTPGAHIEFMSFDLNGLSGHIDHIVAGRTACLVFFRLKKQYPHIMTRIRLRCISDTMQPAHNIDWLYMEKGRSEMDIDETVAATDYNDLIKRVMRTHYTQRKDGEAHIEQAGDDIGINTFIVLK